MTLAPAGISTGVREPGFSPFARKPSDVTIHSVPAFMGANCPRPGRAIARSGTDPWERSRNTNVAGAVGNYTPDVKRRQPRGDPDPQHRAIMRPVCHTQAAFCEGSGMQRGMVDPIPFLVCLGLALLLVWLWHRFKGQ